MSSFIAPVQFTNAVFMLVVKLACNSPERDNNAKKIPQSKSHWSSGRGHIWHYWGV